jgi:large subunit ribosomal protein L24
LSQELRKKHDRRNIPLRKGDTVKITRGKFKGKQGKVTEVKTKMEKIYIEKIQAKKRDGSSVNVPIKASNLQIIELNTEDRKRMKKSTETEKKVKKEKLTKESKEKKSESAKKDEEKKK